MSNLLKKGSELYGKPKGDSKLGLHRPWGGSAAGPDIIAPVSKGRQYDASGKHAAPKRGEK